MDSMELANYLEKVRYGRKISQEKFVDGVCSLRQYQRYRSGECEIPIEKLEAFTKRLGIPSQKLLKDFEKQKKEQDALMDQFYNAVANKDLEAVNRLKKLIEQDIIIEEENKLYYRYSLIRHELVSGSISRELGAKKISDLVGFPKILKNDYFTDIEVLMLSSLLDIIEGDLQKRLLERLTDLFDSQDFIMSGGSDLIYSTILVRLSKIYGILKDFNQVIHFCDLGIQHGLKYKRHYLFDNFYYYKALAYHELEDYYNYELSLFRCYNVLHMEENSVKTERFTKRIEKDFDINFNMFIVNYLNKEFN